MAKIEDGTGTGVLQKVDAAFRAKTAGVSSTIQQDATDREDSFNINSGTVVNSVATEQGILYVKNNETRNLHVTGVIAIIGVSTNGTETNFKMYKNPTAGTLIDSGGTTDADTNSNRNFGSSKTFTADVFKGDGSSTVTDGTVHIESIISPSLTRVFFAIDEVISPGDTTAITFTIAANDSATNCMAALIAHLEDPNT